MCEHNWLLHKESNENYWAYKPRRTFFRKRLVAPYNLSQMFSDDAWYFLHKIIEEWYCTKCREWDVRECEVNALQDVLDRNYCVWDWRNEKWILPKGVEEA